jgi:hypothetical protein
VTCSVWYEGALASFVGDAYAEGRLPAAKAPRSQIVGYRSYLGDDGAGASSNGGGDDADGGENIGLAWKLLPVT